MEWTTLLQCFGKTECTLAALVHGMGFGDIGVGDWEGGHTAGHANESFCT